MTMCTFHDIDRRLSFFGLNGSITTITTISGLPQLSYVPSRLLPRTTDVLDCLDFFRDAVNDNSISMDQAHDSLYTAIMAHYHRIHTTYSSTERFERDDWLGDTSRCVEACALASFSLTSGMIPDMNAMNDDKWKLMNAIGKDHHRFAESQLSDFDPAGFKSIGKSLCQGINDWDIDVIPSTIPFHEALLDSIARCGGYAGRTTAYLRVLSGLNDYEQRRLHAYEHMVNTAIPVFDPDALGILLKAWSNVDAGDISMDDVRKTIGLAEHQHGNISDAVVHVLNGGWYTPETLFILMRWASISMSYEKGSYVFPWWEEMNLHDISPRRLYESIDLPDDFVIENIRVNGWF